LILAYAAFAAASSFGCRSYQQRGFHIAFFSASIFDDFRIIFEIKICQNSVPKCYPNLPRFRHRFLSGNSTKLTPKNTPKFPTTAPSEKFFSGLVDFLYHTRKKKNNTRASTRDTHT